MSSINDTKLVINISHTEPVSLIDLTVGLNALAALYSDFTQEDKKASLLVKEIKKGSIEIDLITLSAASAIPLISDVNNIIQFSHYIKLLIATCKKNSTDEVKHLINEHHLPHPRTSHIKNFGKMLNLAIHSQNKIEIKAQEINNGQVYNNCTINHFDATQMQETIPDLIDEKISYRYNKQLFKWVQTNFAQLKTGNKALISNIHKKPLHVIFDDETIKKEMTEISEDGVRWQDQYYTVDVEVQIGEGNKPMQYKILTHHSGDSFSVAETNA